MKAKPGSKDWTDEDKKLYGIENKGILTWIRTSSIMRFIARSLGLKEKFKDIKITTEFPRGFCRFMREQNKRELIGVEIGAMEGHHALSLFKELNIKKLYLIDPYKHYEGNEEFNISLGNSFIRARNKLKKYRNRIVWAKKLSSDALNDIPDNLDFVYIDGNHTYRYVKEDIEKYYGKIKKGGVLAGHDFDYLSPGVIKAVIEFAVKNNLELNTHPFQSDWWVLKK